MIHSDLVPNLYSIMRGRSLIDDWKAAILTRMDDLPLIYKDFQKQG